MPTDTLSHGDEFRSDEQDIEAFTKSFGDGDNADDAGSTEDEENEGAAEGDSDGTEGEGSEDDDTPEEGEEGDEEDPEVVVKQGDKEHKVKLSALKRLYGQEAALTQKSQKVAEDAKVHAASIERTTQAYKVLLTRAEEAYQPYSQFGAAEWALLAQEMNPEQYNALRAEEKAARANVDFLKTEMQGHMQKVAEDAHLSRQQIAQATNQALANPETGIKGWSSDLYKEMGQFAISQGIHADEFNAVLSAPALKVIWKAMQYDKAQAAARSAASKVVKVRQQATNVLKPGASKTANKGQLGKNAALANLRKNRGDEDAAIAAFQAAF